MKKIINGLRYDTSSAIEVGSASHSYPSDFSHWEATLYRTPRSGRYFLAGEGGAMSMFASRIDQNSWGGGSGIRPLTREEALEWAEANLSTEEIEAGFDEIEEA